MADDLFSSVYNPDVLSCLANLSNDEVFTPPDVVNKLLDMLPQELFRNPDTTFLDPACKTGVFLREIAKRLITGLEPQMPDLQERIDHVFHKQLFAIAITELTSLLSRRGVYCSKYPQSEFSVTQFDDAEGNIRYRNIKHSWVNGKCKFCGISKDTVLGGGERGQTLESHAYEWIHTLKPEEIFNMKFDVIIGNPPYQLSDGGNAASASPLYHKFVEQSMKLKPRYLSMIIPARWYAGGKGLDDFRNLMLGQSHMRNLVDVADSSDCFPGVNVAGGICYFLWDNNYSGECTVINMKDGEFTSEITRPLNEYEYFVRNNMALSIIRKVLAKKEQLMSKSVFSRNYFSLPTTVSGYTSEKPHTTKVLTSKGDLFVKTDIISDKENLLRKHKVIITYAMSGGNKPTAEGNYQILSSLKVIPPYEACTETYLILAVFDSHKDANNLVTYMSGKFSRFLLLQALSSIHITKDKFCFVPVQDFTQEWTDEKLFAKYGISSEEADYIDSSIKLMNISGR